MRADLPIDQARKQLREALAGQKKVRILLKAPTGSGKSTCVPVFLYEDLPEDGGIILVVEPRRVAAKLLASYVARQMRVRLGDEVGYAVRFDRKISNSTRIVYLTDGMLKRWLISDQNALDKVGAIVFDEFHERSLDSDLCLSRVMEIQDRNRPDLSIIVMSATIEMSGLSDFMGHSAHIIETQGRCYPVEIKYTPPGLAASKAGRGLPAPVWEHACKVLKGLADREDCGDVLVFMPGAYEIRKCVELLASRPWTKDRDIYGLHGSMTLEQQNEAIRGMGRPRIIVSTNVAETSLTIEGVKTVIDSGLVRSSGWDARRGINTLVLSKNSKSSADQRAGRAGRTAPGICVRLWGENEHASRPDFDLPEIQRIDLSETILTLKSWGVHAVHQCRWLTPPSPEMVQKSLELLKMLGALDSEGLLTGTGREMLRYPLVPRFSRLLISGIKKGIPEYAAAVVALLQGESVAMKEGLSEEFSFKDDFSDFQSEWRAVCKAVELSFNMRMCSPLGIKARAAREVWETYRQILGLVGVDLRKGRGTLDFFSKREELVDSVLLSFPDNVGKRNGIASNTCRLAGGKGGKLVPGTAGLKSLYLVTTDVAEIGGAGVETRISRCVNISLEDIKRIFPREFVCDEQVVFDPARKRVVSRMKESFHDLVLVEKLREDPPMDKAAKVLATKILAGELVLTGWDYHVEQWVLRLQTLSRLMPELELPDFKEEDHFLLLESFCEGALSYKEIKDKAIMPVLKEWLSRWQLDVLEKYAPVALTLANGSQVKIKYREEQAPVAAIQVQKLFGVRETPVLMNGKCPLSFEILAPNRRIWQVTSSLRSFWDHGYAMMRKDLAGRYPKHHWPETPPH